MCGVEQGHRDEHVWWPLADRAEFATIVEGVYEPVWVWLGQTPVDRGCNKANRLLQNRVILPERNFSHGLIGY